MGAAGLQPLRFWLDAFWRLGDSSRALLIKLALTLALALGVAALIASTPFYKNLYADLADWNHQLLAQNQAFTGLTLIDADQDSLDILAPSYGTWPYGRDVFAMLITYLRQAGARAVVIAPWLELERQDGDALEAVLTGLAEELHD